MAGEGGGLIKYEFLSKTLESPDSEDSLGAVSGARLRALSLSEAMEVELPRTSESGNESPILSERNFFAYRTLPKAFLRY